MFLQKFYSLYIRCKCRLLQCIFFVFFLSLNYTKAQNKNIDSLLTLLKSDKADTSKVIHLNNLCREYIDIGLYDKALHFGNNALQLSAVIVNQGVSSGTQSVIKRSAEKSIARSYGNLGLIYYYQSNDQKTLLYWMEALKIDEKLKNKKGIATQFSYIGNVYYRQSDYSKTLDYFFKALKIAEELEDKPLQATTLGNIGNVYADLADYPKSLIYYFKALKKDEELANKTGIARHFGNIGIVYKDQGDYPKALDYYFKALKTGKELGEKNSVARHLSNIGNVYFEQKNYTQALANFLMALKITEDLGYKNGIATNLGAIGTIYTTTGKFKEAEQSLKKAIAIANKIGALGHLCQFEVSLSQLYDTTRNYKDALIHYKKSIALKDTIFSQENRKQLVQKEMNYEFDKKEAITKAENEKQQAIAEEKNRRQKIITWSVACGLILLLVFASFIFRSLRITRKQKQIIEKKNTETELQKKIIEEKNKDITDSIRYAKRIQDALMGEQGHVSFHLPEHFILFMPKDIVSGDFHWGAEKQGHWYFAAVDCTGHGVPGAVMSMLGISFLNDIVASEKLYSPAEVLNHLRDKIVKELRQTGEAGGSKDGMDISLCRLNLKTNELQWAGAYNPLNLFRNGQLEEVKADKQPIGYHLQNHPFTNHEIQLQKGDSIYIYSDGYADQFGGPKGKKFKYKQLEDLIIANNYLPMNDQKILLKTSFNEWKGSLEQIDDVCVFGVRV